MHEINLAKSPAPEPLNRHKNSTIDIVPHIGVFLSPTNACRLCTGKGNHATDVLIRCLSQITISPVVLIVWPCEQKSQCFYNRFDCGFRKTIIYFKSIQPVTPIGPCSISALAAEPSCGWYSHKLLQEMRAIPVRLGVCIVRNTRCCQ